MRERYGLEGRTLSGDEEARLTYLGATAARDAAARERLLVIDIGGGSTELVIGEARRGRLPRLDAGRRRAPLRAPPARATRRRADELAALADDVGRAFAAAVPAAERERVTAAVAVAGTATQCAGIDLGAEGSTSRATGCPPTASTASSSALAAVPLEQRREVPGLDPDRAPTIVAGVVVLIRALAAFGLAEVEVSDRDILWGAALELASASRVQLTPPIWGVSGRLFDCSRFELSRRESVASARAVVPPAAVR